MKRKLLYEIGNLFTGRPHAVIVTKPFGSYEVHGPFKSENVANTYMHQLAESGASEVGETYGVVQIDLLPEQDRRIRRTEHGLQYEPI